jgi:outer membrane biogenesis lipoprotein LolB
MRRCKWNIQSKWRCFSTLLFATLLISGCASLAPPIPAASGESKETIARSGRFSVTTYQLDQQTILERQNGSFNADISEIKSRIDLLSPLGQILARVTVAPQFAVIETAQGQKFEDYSDIADLRVTEQALGMPLPLQGLTKNLQDGAKNTPVVGWETEILETIGAQQRPRRIKMTWIRHNSESANNASPSSPEIGRIVVLVIINE